MPHVPLIRKVPKTHEAVIRDTFYILSGLVVVGDTVRFDISTADIVDFSKIVCRLTLITVAA
jgi:hypothetical protein